MQFSTFDSFSIFLTSDDICSPLENVDSEYSEDNDKEEAKLRNIRLQMLSLNAPNRNSLCKAQSNYELNANTPLIGQFTLN